MLHLSMAHNKGVLILQESSSLNRQPFCFDRPNIENVVQFFFFLFFFGEALNLVL